MIDRTLFTKSTFVIQFFVAMLLFGTYQSFSLTINTGQNIMLAEIIEIIEEVEDEENSQADNQDEFVQPILKHKNSNVIETHTSRTKFKYLYSVFDIVIPPPEQLS